MSTQLVKDTLKDENELLDAMIKLVAHFNNANFTKEAKFIQSSWQRFLQDRYDTNHTQQGSNADELKKDFLAEISQLGAYICATPTTPAYSEKWRKFLECESAISGHLFNLIDK